MLKSLAEPSHSDQPLLAPVEIRQPAAEPRGHLVMAFQLAEPDAGAGLQYVVDEAASLLAKYAGVPNIERSVEITCCRYAVRGQPHRQTLHCSWPLH